MTGADADLSRTVASSSMQSSNERLEMGPEWSVASHLKQSDFKPDSHLQPHTRSLGEAFASFNLPVESSDEEKQR
jgi:hypothetical protein